MFLLRASEVQVFILGFASSILQTSLWLEPFCAIQFSQFSNSTWGEPKMGNDTDSIIFSGFEDTVDTAELEEAAKTFCEEFDPLERSAMIILKDDLTGAAFTECHVQADRIIAKGTTDVPLDPDEAPEYRANRDVVYSHAAFERMQQDALQGRKFSNIVCEYSPTKKLSLEVIGGQHRFEAIAGCASSGVNVHHGLKVYFNLNKEQRLDVQVISNTNISVPTDLLDRMFATIEGTDLREWCQKCGLLEKGRDFADMNKKGNPITVKEARTFIVNYFLGRAIAPEKFESVETTPAVVESGTRNPKLWTDVKDKHPELWSDAGLLKAGKEFASLINAQVEFYRDPKSKKLKGKADQIYKTKNVALLAAWAFVAGSLQANPTRLERHYGLRTPKAKDPLKAELLVKGKHHTDSESYRGLGFRSDAKERGRFTQLFWLQAEKGGGFTAAMIDSSIKGYEAKRANLAYEESKSKI